MEKEYPAHPGKAEYKYVEFDPEFDCWGVFGLDSGFCYGQYGSEKAAQESIDNSALA